MSAPPHAATFGAYLSLMGARPAPAHDPRDADPTNSFLALSRERGMFRAESNLRFIVDAPGGGERLIVLREPEATAFAEAVGTCRDFLSLSERGVASCVFGEVSEDHFLEGAMDALPRLTPPITCTLERKTAAAAQSDGTRTLVAAQLRAHDGTPLASVSRLQLREGAAVEARILLPDLGRVPISDAIPPVSLAYFDEGVVLEALDMALRVRHAGIGCWFFHGVKNLAKHLRLADRHSAKYVVIVGGSEWEQGNVAIRECDSKREEAVPIERVVSALREIIQ